MIPYSEIGLRLALAALLGGAVGLDRQRLNWAAGLRTHMLVCSGAALFMIVSAFGFFDILKQDHIALDPSRIAAQVVNGVGFLGAGTILVRRHAIHGINTAAGLWLVAAVGLAVGGGMYVVALITTLLIVLILAGLKPIEQRLFSRRRRYGLSITVQHHVSVLPAVEAALGQLNIDLLTISVKYDREQKDDVIQIAFGHSVTQQVLLRLIEQLRVIEGVKKIDQSLNYAEVESVERE